MLKLTFKQTPAELMVRTASTIIFNTLNQLHYPSVALSELAENPQYGFTASASVEEVGAKFVRITDLKDGGINWDTVPYCKCDEPEKYLIYPNDILFARTGATTGKTHLVKEAPYAVFASYLIRIRPKALVEPEYLYSFFQSDAYWTQILDEKEGSAQPNVNGQKLMKILVPMVDSEIQSAISKFLEVVRKRQDGSFEELPELPPPLEQQRRIMMRVEELVGKVEEVRSLRQTVIEECDALCRSIIFSNTSEAIPTPLHKLIRLRDTDVAVSPEETYNFAGVYCFGRGLFRQQNQKGIEFSYKHLTRLKAGNFVYPKLMAWEGALGVVPPELDGCVVSPEFPVFEVNENRVLPEVLEVYFRTPSVWDTLSQISTGTNVRRRRLHPSNFLEFKLPLPSMRTQQQLREVKRKVDTIKHLRQHAIEELDALLPSILDKAFKGEL